MNDIRLFFAPGSCSKVPLIALEEIGVPFEAILLTFMTGAHKKADYLALNPAGKIPTLVLNGQAVTQNVAILSLLAELYPAAKLLPEIGNPMERAQQISVLSWISSDLHQLVTRIRVPLLACDKPEAAPRVREMAETAMRAQLMPVNEKLSTQPWLFGQSWSIADAYLYWVWWRIVDAGFDGSDFKNLADHRNRIEQRPSVQNTIAREAAAQAELVARGLVVDFSRVSAKPELPSP